MQSKIDFNKIKIEKLSWRDFRRVKEFQKYINSLVEEDAMISLSQKQTIEEKKMWLEESLQNIKEKRKVLLVAKDGNKVAGISEIKLRKGRENHIGMFGISVRKEYRGKGLGTKLMAEILKEAEKELKPRPKIIRLSVFSENTIAQNLYKKFGFREVARIPKQLEYKGKLTDEV
ncbi:MAG TPA: GNAT family N-acetyltransferase, partial [Candidatus Pacearchaeota archaeon]|nr:GNAT family N-acetyltransferase [Candidatus Pacearchaeota archaeon]HOK94298.1 GNAT family N-acetyltransferase [Candidatus Pacearchaeota archaeon]HPO75426.1 GNAT family N-acetyltransferase [Candidatus Pacearchaeota archaeon]